MKILNKILDNYYTSKVIEIIKNKLIKYCMKIEIKECMENKIEIYINYIGKRELKNSIYLINFRKSDSFELLISNNFMKEIEKQLLITIQMFEK